MTPLQGAVLVLCLAAWSVLVWLLSEILLALKEITALLRRDIAHRDVKPENPLPTTEGYRVTTLGDPRPPKRPTPRVIRMGT